MLERLQKFTSVSSLNPLLFMSLGVRQVPRPRIQFLGASDEEEEEQEEQNTLKATTNQFMPSNVRPKIRFTAAKEEKKKTKVCTPEKCWHY